MMHPSIGGLSRLVGLALGVLSLAVAPVSAQEGRAAGEYNLGNGRLAIQGYDPVAYFESGGSTPAKGRPEFAYLYEGVVYRFATEAHRTIFVAAPESYEPAHGGWCSYAMSKNKQIGIDPQAFRIGEGRLLLFVDTDYLAFDGDWVPTEHKSLAQADKNWKAMTGESARTAPPGSWRLSNEWNLSQASLAIEGYDPVSYFPEGGGKPTKGKAKYAVRHDGVLYRFATEEHAAAFEKDPAKYEPQHGGWCSYAMGANGEKVEVDPKAFRLTDGHLHLFYTGWFADTREDWDKDTDNLKSKADTNWGKLLEKAQPTS